MTASFLVSPDSSNNLVILTIILALSIIVAASPVLSSPINTVTVTETITLPPVTIGAPQITPCLPCTLTPEPYLIEAISVGNSTNYYVVAFLILSVAACATYTYLSIFKYNMAVNPSMAFISALGLGFIGLLVNMISSNLAKLSSTGFIAWILQTLSAEIIYLFTEMLYINLHINLYLYYALSIYYHLLDCIPFLDFLGDYGLMKARWLVIIGISAKLIIVVICLV